MQAVRAELLVYIPQKLMEQMLLISSWEEEFTVKAFLKGMSIFKYEKEQNKVSVLVRGVTEWSMWLIREQKGSLTPGQHTARALTAVKTGLLHDMYVSYRTSAVVEHFASQLGVGIRIP